jgi:hypothetical protein
LRFLRSLGNLVELIGVEVYGTHGPDDWTALAAALAIGCPIWSEDADIFGCGVATWTSSRIRMFLRAE